MDFIIEFILELILEGSMEIGTNKKISKFIRYPLLVLIILFYMAFIFLFIYIGINVLKDNIIGGAIIILIGIVLALITIYAFHKKIKEKENESKCSSME